MEKAMASMNPQWSRVWHRVLRLFAIFLLACLTGLVSPSAWSQTSPQLPEYQFRERTNSCGDNLKHVVYVPRNLKAGRKYPLAVYLHGRCDECVTHERILQESGLRWWHEMGQGRAAKAHLPAGAVGGIGRLDQRSTPAR